MNRTGVYLAYPTTTLLKPIYPGYKTLVNCNHTKVGITQSNFANRCKTYMKVFDGGIMFVPVLELPSSQLKHFEKVLLQQLSSKYQRVGLSREWLATDARQDIINTILNLSGN